jgi:hypothetical protein
MKNNKITYYEHFRAFIPNYKRAYFKAKLQNDLECIIDLKANIYKNWNLTKEQKLEILKEIGVVE